MKQTTSTTTMPHRAEVAPHAGAWIETRQKAVYLNSGLTRSSRPPRGGVD